MGNLKVLLGGLRTNRASAAVELVGTSNKSECPRESEMRGACLAFFIPQSHAKRIQPYESAFHNPVLSLQTTAMFRIVHGQ